ncbi:hypothetical protein Avbf_10131 [Armadillidium vulgare]|nr:hypothetical protein Avbf_10131 [Armadillidium vulgare]
MDKDFETDDEGGHCDEVTKSFSSMLSFVCCKVVKEKVEADDVYKTTISPVTVMEDKFQLLDENPIPIEPPVKSTTPSSLSPVISPSMISSASSSSNNTSSVSTSTEITNLSPTSSTSVNDYQLRKLLKKMNSMNWNNSSNVTSQTETFEYISEETTGVSTPSDESNSSTFSNNVSNVKIITTEPETSSYILSTSDELRKEEPLDKPSNTDVTTSNSITNSSSEIDTNNEENTQTSNDEPKSNQTTTTSPSTTTEMIEISSVKNESPDNIENSNSTEKSVVGQNNSNTESFNPQDIINQISQTLMENYSTTGSPSVNEENSSKSTPTTMADTTSQTVTDNSSIKNEENKTSTPNEVPLSNHVLNLPEEIRNYLERKQAEKNSKKEKVTIPTSTMSSGYPMMSTTIKVSTDDLFDNYSTTTTFSQTKFVLKPAKLPNLQGTPISSPCVDADRI